MIAEIAEEIIKHLPNQHDQKAHAGNYGKGGGDDSDLSEIVLRTSQEWYMSMTESARPYLVRAFEKLLPVNADLFDGLEPTRREPKLELPEGYVKKGDNYIFIAKKIRTPLVQPGEDVSRPKLFSDGQYRIAKIGFKRTGPGADDYETALRWYLPKTRSDISAVRRQDQIDRGVK